MEKEKMSLQENISFIHKGCSDLRLSMSGFHRGFVTDGDDIDKFYKDFERDFKSIQKRLCKMENKLIKWWETKPSNVITEKIR
jgi:hypothetical protein